MKTIMTTIGLLLYATLSLSQTNLYTKTKTFIGEGYVYQCDVSGAGWVTLYNKSNKWTYVNQIHEGTGEPYYLTDDNYAPAFEEDFSEELSEWQRREIFRNVFEQYEYAEQLRGHRLTYTLCISSQTGKVSEIYFEFNSLNSPYAKVPVERYREIETQILNIHGYTLTPIARELNYVFVWHVYEPNHNY